MVEWATTAAITATGAMVTAEASAALWESDPAAGGGFPALARCTSATKQHRVVSVHARAPISSYRNRGSVDLENTLGENVSEAPMKRCVQCYGKLGLGVRSRNLWNGRWWVRVRFCSSHCEAHCELGATTPTHGDGVPSSHSTKNDPQPCCTGICGGCNAKLLIRMARSHQLLSRRLCRHSAATQPRIPMKRHQTIALSIP